MLLANLFVGRSADASRILTSADFHLSVESEASVHSHLSTTEQDPIAPPQTEPPSAPSRTTLLESFTHPNVHPKEGPLRPTPLNLAQENSPLLHVTWASLSSDGSELTQCILCC